MTKNNIIYYLKYSLLILTGILTGLVVFEIGVRFYKGAPPEQIVDWNFKCEYLEIYDNIFIKDTRSGKYVSFGQRCHKVEFPVNKGKKEKRVFLQILISLH